MKHDRASETPADILQATRRGRWRVALLVVLALSTLGGFHFFAVPQLIAILDSVSGKPPSIASLRQLQGMFIGLGLLGLVTAAIILQHGAQVLRQAQSPPNNFWLWRDTPVVRGIKARWRGWINIVMALLTGLICAGLVVYIVLTLQRFAPYTLRDGVSIIDPNAASR
jgi:hypothetical protein